MSTNLIIIKRDIKYLSSIKCFFGKFNVSVNFLNHLIEFKKKYNDLPADLSDEWIESLPADLVKGTHYDNPATIFKKKTGVASARAGNVIGGGDWSDNRLIPDTIKSLQNKIVVFIRNPNFNRPWQHVLEPLRGYLILAEKIYKKPRY